MNIINSLRKKTACLCYALIMLAVAVLPSCGGDSGSGTSAETGEVIIGLTDAQGDFATYTVSVQSLTLTKANGTVVETVPLSSDIDFAQYTQMTEFFTVATIPSGLYVKATMVLDYSSADIQVEKADGNATPIPAGNIIDSDGATITTLEVSVHLEGRNSLLIVPGVPAHLTLDFDLQASNDVSFDTDPPTLTVEPFLLADLQLDKPKIHRVRGPLRSVDPANNSFQVFIRPFFHRIDPIARHFGTLTVTTSDQTVYEIDGQVYQGAAGLEALNALPSFSAVVAIGDLERLPRRFVASEVYAGSSVPGGDKDALRGTVIARSGDVLTVKGATLIRQDGTVVFNDTVTVTVDADTTVFKQADVDISPSIADISVGSRVGVFGILTNTDPNSLEMDATGADNFVRLMLSNLLGRINQINTAEIVLNLKAINGRHVELYGKFVGTGTTTPDDDADPLAYEVSTGTISLANLSLDSIVRVRGFVSQFGTAPPDFNAITIIDTSGLPARIAVSWDPASTTPFTSIGQDGLLINLVGTGRFHHIAQGGYLTDLTTLAAAPNLVATESGNGIYVIKQNETVTMYTTYANMIDGLSSRLDGVNAMAHLAASGGFAWDSSTLTSHFISVLMAPASTNQ